MNDTIINPRQQQILEYLGNRTGASRQELENLFDPPVAKITLIRDLNDLVAQNLVSSKGQARATSYQLRKSHPFIWYVDLASYFSQEADQRAVAHITFEADMIGQLTDILSTTERNYFAKENRDFEQRLTATTDSVNQRELERYIIELSWKSSRIEGNTYSLLETEALIKRSQAAVGHSQEEAKMILNHKEAFDTIFQNRTSFKQLTLTDIESIHSLIVKDLGIDTGLRQRSVGITGTTYRPPDNLHQIRESVEKIINHVNDLEDPIEKALLATLLLSQLQPFADGNKRTARMVGTALLLAHNYRPVSYRSADEIAYKQSMILFYEQHNLYHYKRIFLDQVRFAIENYFR